MISTSQNRVAVIQANAVNVRGQVLSAAVVHQRLLTMRPYMTRRTRLPFGTPPAFLETKRRPSEDRPIKPACGDAGSSLHPRLWASLVLGKASRG